MKPRLPCLLATSIAFFAPAADAIEYSALQGDKSRITFVSKQMGVPVHGRFAKFTARIAFDPARPEAGKATLGIDLASIDAGSKDANDEVGGKAWFNVSLFPVATFASSSIKSLGGGKYQVAGTLTIKGKSQPIGAPFTFKSEGNGGVFEGSFPVKRIDFAIGDGPWADVSMVANEVQVHFHLVATPGATQAAAAGSK